MSDKVKHLEFISNTIDRLSQNSFQIKGWAVIVTAAILGIALDPSKQVSAMFAVGPLWAFWMLDAYYLGLERRYRRLFDSVRSKDSGEVDFCMTPPSGDGVSNGYFAALCSKTLIITYVGLGVLISLATLLL